MKFLTKNETSSIFGGLCCCGSSPIYLFEISADDYSTCFIECWKKWNGYYMAYCSDNSAGSCGNTSISCEARNLSELK